MKHKKHLIAALFSLSFMWACGSATEQTATTTAPNKTEDLFSSKCSMCHAFNEDKIGPALAGVQQRWNDKQKLKAFIRNSQAVIAGGDPYATALYAKWNQSAMPSFPELSEQELDELIEYLK